MSLITIKASEGDCELTFPVDRFVSISLIGKGGRQPALDITLAGAVTPHLLFFWDTEVAEKLRSDILRAVESKEPAWKHWEFTWDMDSTTGKS